MKKEKLQVWYDTFTFPLLSDFASKEESGGILRTVKLLKQSVSGSNNISHIVGAHVIFVD